MPAYTEFGAGLTSATSAVEIPVFVGIKSPHAINFLEKTSLGKLEIKTVYSGDPDKLTTLYRLLGELNGGPTLIFCNYREHAERISTYLRKQAVENEFFHGGLEQAERERVLCKFRNGSTTILISTDLAARGLDIPEIEYTSIIISRHTEEAFIHRNGRTARMKASGTAFVLIGESKYFLPISRKFRRYIVYPAKIRFPRNRNGYLIHRKRKKR